MDKSSAPRASLSYAAQNQALLVVPEAHAPDRRVTVIAKTLLSVHPVFTLANASCYRRGLGKLNVTLIGGPTIRVGGSRLLSRAADSTQLAATQGTSLGKRPRSVEGTSD